MRVGIFAKTFPRPTLEETLDAIAGRGLTHVQFNLSCVGLPTLPDEDPSRRPDPWSCRKIAKAFADRGLTMAAISGTFNVIDPDGDARARGLLGLRRLIERAPLLGAPVVTLCSGTRSRLGMWSPHPENASPDAWEDLKAALKRPVRLAEIVGVTLAIEPEVANVVDSARKARRLLDEVGSPALKVVIDPANLFHEGELSRMGEVLDEAFDLLGKDVVLAHAKDLSRDGEAGSEAAGTGLLDYDRYVRLLRESSYDGPLVLHGLREGQVPATVEFLRSKLAR